MRIHSPQITGSAENTNIVTTTRITSLSALSASFAATASSADNLTVRGTLTAQTINVQTITSSIDFVTGSSKNGSLLTNTHEFTGSVGITGSLQVNGSDTILTNQTSSMSVATASFVQTAQTASFVQNAISASFALTASHALNVPETASFALNANTASFALTASHALNVPETASFALNANTASFVLNAVSSSFAATASFVQNSISSSFAATASSADNLTVRGTLTAQTINVQTITSSIEFVTGSTRNGSISSNTHQFTGSVLVSGSVVVPSLSVNATSGGFSTPRLLVNNGSGVSIGFQVIADSEGRVLRFQTADYNNTNTGSTLRIGFGVGSGNTHALIQAFSAGESVTNNLILQAGGGKLGIGTDAPSSLLHTFSVTNGAEVARFEGAFASSGTVVLARFSRNGGAVSNVIRYSDTSGLIEYGSTTGHNIAFITNNTERMRITSAGNVGIGTTTPDQLVSIRKTSPGSETIALALQNIGSTAGTAVSMVFCPHESSETPEPLAKIMAQRVAPVNAPCNLIFYTYNSGLNERMRISSEGNVGIGTSSPAVRLDVTGTDDVDSSLFFRVYSNNRTVFTGLGYRRIETNSELSIIANDSTIFRNSGSERMRITSGGTLGISNSGDVNNAGIDRLAIGYFVGNYGWIQTYSTTPLYLNKVGNAVYAGTARIDNNSDMRVKDNIQPITGALDKVLSMNGKKFHMLDEPESKIRLGFIAQELQGVVDELVIESDRTQTLPNGDVIENILGLETWGSSWAALLVEAIKELSAENNTLKEILQRNNIQ